VLREPDKDAAAEAAKLGLETVIVADGYDVEFDRGVFVEPGVTIPWDLLPIGLRLLERWDMAVPLWRYGVTAETLGTAKERESTKQITLDLRVLLYAHELLLVRNSPDGLDFLAAWSRERASGGEPRLAFLRALYATKPIFCTLPRSWLAEIERRPGRGDRKARRRAGRVRTTQHVDWSPSRKSRREDDDQWVTIEIRPGLRVRCRRGEEETALARYRKLQSRKRRV